MNTTSQLNYLYYADDYYPRVQSGYLHASPAHYNIVGRPHLGSMTQQITDCITRVNNLNKKQTQLDKIIKQQEKKENDKLKSFVAIYNETAEKPISGSGTVEITIQINKLITQKGFKANNPYNSPKVTQAIGIINSIIHSYFSETVFSDSKVNSMTPNEFMALYEISEDILKEITRMYQTEENIIIREVHAFPMRKIQGFLSSHSAQYKIYANKNKHRKTVPDTVLNEVMELVGTKAWGARDTRKTAANVKSSFQASARGGANQLQGVTLERTISGYIDDTDLCGDVANLIKGMVEGKIAGKMIGNRQDQFKKQQKIDVEWSFTTLDEQQQKINLSSKVHTGAGDIVIHSGGGLDTYIARFSENLYSKPIAQLFKNSTFRYFFANEFYGASMGGNIDPVFRNTIYNAIKVNIPTLLGIEFEKRQVSLFNGVDFMNVNQTIIPISTILRRVKENLKNYEKITRGMSITIDADNTGGNFLSSRKNLLKTIPMIPYESYYTDKTLLSRGYQDMNSYINHIKIGVNLTSSLIDQSIAEATGEGGKKYGKS